VCDAVDMKINPDVNRALDVLEYILKLGRAKPAKLDKSKILFALTEHSAMVRRIKMSLRGFEPEIQKLGKMVFSSDHGK